MASGLTLNALRLKRTRVRNEIAIRHSDSAQGGPTHAEELKTLRAELAELDKEIDEIQREVEKEGVAASK